MSDQRTREEIILATSEDQGKIDLDAQDIQGEDWWEIEFEKYWKFFLFFRAFRFISMILGQFFQFFWTKNTKIGQFLEKKQI